MSEECKDLITGMLAKDPRGRLSMGEVLAHPWMAIEEEESKSN